jgi:hypothetical protein
MADCATWWFDHVGETYMYVVATRQGDQRMQTNAVDKLVDGAEEWGSLLKIENASKLMNNHVALVKQLTDAAFAKEQAKVDEVVEALIANAGQQTMVYENDIPGFPKEEWEKLFLTHLTSTGGYILALSSGDTADFRKNYNTVIANRNNLARFWGRLCLILRR